MASIPAASRGKNTAALWILAVNSAMAFAVGGAFGPVQELAKIDLGFTDMQMSLLMGLAVSLPVALLAIPLGRLVDRANRVYILMAMGVAWTLGTALCAVASSFELLFFARMLVGTGALCSLPVVISIAADLSEIERRGHAMVILAMGKIVGAASAFLLGGALVGALVAGKGPAFIGGAAHWRVVLGAFAALSGLLLLPLILLREPQRHELGEAAGQPLRPALRAIWRRRALLIPLFIGQISVTMADYAANVWAAPVLTRNYGQTTADFGGWMGGESQVRYGLAVVGFVTSLLSAVGFILAMRHAKVPETTQA